MTKELNDYKIMLNCVIKLMKTKNEKKRLGKAQTLKKLTAIPYSLGLYPMTCINPSRFLYERLETSEFEKPSYWLTFTARSPMMRLNLAR
jgi:hypothetical protein